MPSRHHYDAALDQIAAGIASDDRRLARRLTAGPIHPLRRTRRWCAGLLVTAVAVVLLGAMAASAATMAVGGTLGLLAAMTAGGLSLVVWSSERHASGVLAPHDSSPAVDDLPGSA